MSGNAEGMAHVEIMALAHEDLAGNPPAALPGLRDLRPGWRIRLDDVFVLFADLRKSSLLTYQLGNDTMDQLLDDFRRFSASVITDCGGKMYDFPGDGILAVFNGSAGPLSLFDAAERIVTAVDEIAVLIKDQMSAATPIAVGIGLDRGPILARRSFHGETDKISLTGDCANVAAALAKSVQPPNFTVATIDCCAALEDIPADWWSETINVGTVPRHVRVTGPQPYSQILGAVVDGGRLATRKA